MGGGKRGGRAGQVRGRPGPHDPAPLDRDGMIVGGGHKVDDLGPHEVGLVYRGVELESGERVAAGRGMEDDEGGRDAHRSS